MVPVHVGLNVIGMLGRREDGGAVYTRQLLKALASVDRTNLYTIFASYRDQDSAGFVSAHQNFKSAYVGLPENRSLPTRALTKLLRSARVWPEATLVRQTRRQRVQIAHQMAPTRSGLDLPVPTVVSIHDLYHEYCREFLTPEAAADRQITIRQWCEKASAIITFSHFTRDTLATRYGMPDSKVHVIYHGVGDEFHPRSRDDLHKLRDRLGLPGAYLFYPGSLLPHKNHSGLLPALDILKRRHGLRLGLVLTGVGIGDPSPLKEQASRLGVEDQVIFLGKVVREEMPLLYNAASVMVYPSLFEGFGLPLVEAMASGCPIACSNAACLPEILGDSGLLFDPLKPDEIANAVYNIVTDDHLRAELVRRGIDRARHLSWEKVARETIQVYEETYFLERNH